MVNPCSKKAVREVIKHVRKSSSVGLGYDTRYIFAAELQDNVFVCTIYGIEIDKVDHQKIRMDKATFNHIFDDVLFRPRHVKLNMVRKLLSLCWTPFLYHFWGYEQ